MHDDGAVEPYHLELARSAVQHVDVVVPGDHVAPPRLLDVALQFHPERPIVPEAVQAAVDLARLKEEAPTLAQRHQFFHVHVWPHSSSSRTSRNGPRRTTGTRRKASTFPAAAMSSLYP